MIKYGQQIEITIQKIITGGDGIGKYKNIVVMVPYSVPQDKLLVKIAEVKKNFARAKISKIILPSPFRIIPVCSSHFSLLTSHCLYCGGCNFQMIKYEKQLDIKTKIVQDFFDIRVNETLPAENPFRYRNKIQIPIGGKTGNIIMGFFQPQSHRIVDIKNCFLQTTEANKIIKEIRNLINEFRIQPYNENRHIGVLRHIVLRQSFVFNEFMIIFVTKTNSMPNTKEIISRITKKFTNIVSVYQNINPHKTNVILGNKNYKLFGRNTIREKIGDIIFEISPASFFQINTYQTLKLYELIKKICHLKGDENIIDIYCGCGGITLYLGPYCQKITGIEKVSSAISDAVRNTRINNIKNAVFICSNADYILKKTDFPKNSTVILDPPRTGCSAEVLKIILDLLPNKIIYVSCNPAILSRDIKILSKKYQLSEIQPIDMFPQTAHIECVAKLTQRTQRQTG
ncbi:MAG: 23S rRNA (uracil(1939)-C(5))-methyltransferase RlmD [Elusimicrobiota bacterium]